MSISLGLTNVSNIKIGNTTVQSAYLGNEYVFGSKLYILDLFSSAHHAYSLRKLRNSYTGKCLRIRRTTTTPTVTTTTVDLSFDSNDTISLNSAITYVSGTVTLATNLGQFCASVVNGYSNPDVVNTNQSIFVVTWFDQSGNNKNPTRTTAANQPLIVENGLLKMSGGKPAVRFTKSLNTTLILVDTTVNTNNMSSFFVGQNILTTTGQIGYSLSTSTFFNVPFITLSNIYASYSISAAILLEPVNTNRNLYELIAPSPLNSAVAQAWANGGVKGTYPLTSGASTDIRIGGAGPNSYDGYIQEVIGWQTNSSRVEKEININNYWAIY